MRQRALLLLFGTLRAYAAILACVIARGASLVAIERVGILFGICCSLVAALALLARNDTMSATKVAPPFVMLSEAKHLFWILYRF